MQIESYSIYSFIECFEIHVLYVSVVLLFPLLMNIQFINKFQFDYFLLLAYLYLGAIVNKDTENFLVHVFLWIEFTFLILDKFILNYFEYNNLLNFFCMSTLRKYFAVKRKNGSEI